MMFGGIITVTHDGQTSHHYKKHSDTYETPALIFKANKIASECNMDIHEAYEHMNHEGRYIDKNLSTPDQRMFETISDSIVGVMLDGFGKNKAVMQHITLDFDEGTWTHNYNPLCFAEQAQTYFHEDIPAGMIPEQKQTQGMYMGM